jgi:Rps23 Pro-64 3,4-dihydroxylase Tpa1-like proline 4-hydroxylase
VRQEILKNLHFTPKETDIYRIHQSGDLANLDGLPRSALKLLPSLRQLRDSLYSKLFRDFIRGVTGCGPLSGRKTDMAINVYTPGSHLLTHDDVIGSRRVSYILYLTSPDQPWQASWGGALRLYPTKVARDGVTRVLEPQWSKVIPPAWNQLSFFEVQPGRSFHDVEEVYAEEEGEEQRVRMAISGWFHIPQEGEGGYIEGLEEELAQKSSLQQLQSKSDIFDLPKRLNLEDDIDSGEDEEESEGDDLSLSEKDLDFLLKFISPTYLTPDTLENMAEAFAEDSSVQITNFLSKAFSKKLKEYIRPRDGREYSSENSEGWKVAVPPHKHRFLYLQKPPTKKAVDTDELNPVEQLLRVLLPSKPFSKLLQLATGMKLTPSSCDLLARRFRRGLDYTLATVSGGDADDGFDEEDEGVDGGDQTGADLKVEVCLGITPSKGWGGEDDENDEEDDEEQGKNGKSKGKGKAKIPKITPFDDSEKTVGGYEM